MILAETGGLILKLTKTTRNNMAYRSKKRQPDRRVSTRDGAGSTKFKTYQLPPDPEYRGPNGEPAPKSFSLPVNQQVMPNQCQLMTFGNTLPSSTGIGGSPVIGPNLQLNVAPPLSGQYAGISAPDFVIDWGNQDVNGNYYMPASGNLNLKFNLRIWSNGGTPPTWNILGLYPGMWYFSVRLYSKATVQKANGTQFDCHFEVKNFIPSIGFVTPPQAAAGGGWLYPGPPAPAGSPNIPSYDLHFMIEQRSLSKCLWKYGQLSFYPQNQPPQIFGEDSNFGLNMNQSAPVDNMWGYGDRIILQGIQAEINPFWGLKNCSYSIAFDEDGDGIPDDFYGNTVDPITQAPTGPGNAGQNLTTMIPSETKILVFD